MGADILKSMDGESDMRRIDYGEKVIEVVWGNNSLTQFICVLRQV